MAKHFGTEDVDLELEDDFRNILEIDKYSPEYWVARYSHNWLCGEPRIYKYADKKLEEWIYKAFDLLDQNNIQDLRNKILTKDELIQLEIELKSDW